MIANDHRSYHEFIVDFDEPTTFNEILWHFIIGILDYLSAKNGQKGNKIRSKMDSQMMISSLDKYMLWVILSLQTEPNPRMCEKPA